MLIFYLKKWENFHEILINLFFCTLPYLFVQLYIARVGSGKKGSDPQPLNFRCPKHSEFFKTLILQCVGPKYFVYKKWPLLNSLNQNFLVPTRRRNIKIINCLSLINQGSRVSRVNFIFLKNICRRPLDRHKKQFDRKYQGRICCSNFPPFPILESGY